jgi:capsular polysaccharide biosynthesis protein
VFAIVAVIAGALALRDLGRREWVSNSQIFVSAVPKSAGPAATSSQLLSYEAEARQIALDLSQIVTSRRFAAAIRDSPALRGSGMSVGALQSDMSASNRERLLTVTASAPTREESDAIGRLADEQLIMFRARYVGPFEAQRSDLRIVSPPTAARASAGHIATTLGLRVVLGALVALALALAWDYLDDSVHSASDLERWLEAPVLATIER